MINPMQLLQMASGSPSPMGVLNSAAQQSPPLRQVMSMVSGHTPQQMEDMAYDLAAKRGIDLNQMAENMGIRLPHKPAPRADLNKNGGNNHG